MRPGFAVECSLKLLYCLVVVSLTGLIASEPGAERFFLLIQVSQPVQCCRLLL